MNQLKSEKSSEKTTNVNDDVRQKNIIVEGENN